MCSGRGGATARSVTAACALCFCATGTPVDGGRRSGSGGAPVPPTQGMDSVSHGSSDVAHRSWEAGAEAAPSEHCPREDGVAWYLQKLPSRDCQIAAPPSIFSRCINSDGEGMSTK